jgi:hypothetical protein
MALTITTVNTGTNGTSTTNNTTLTITGVTASVGDVLFFAISAANSGTGGAPAVINSITDNASGSVNRYDQVRRTNWTAGTASDGATLFFFECLVETALSSNTITITFSANNPQKAVQAYRIEPGVGEVPQLLFTTTGVGGATRTSHIADTVYVENGDTIFGAASIETDDAVTGDSDTTNGSWSTVQTRLADAGVDASAM